MNIVHTMCIMDGKPILNDSESPSQDDIKTSRLQEDGLRILARIIARDLLAKRSMHAEKNDSKVNDAQASADR